MLLVLLVAVTGAIVPTVIYVSFAWWFDRYEKEPWWLLALAFLWGAIPAIILATISELAIAVPLTLLAADAEATPDAPPKANFITVVVVAPLVEESLKAVPLLCIFCFFRREFDGLMDGLLYGAITGLGFAMTENFFYIFGAGTQGGVGAGLLVLFMRTVIFGVAHALWTSMFGIGLAIARFSKSRKVAVIAPCAGLLVGMLMHTIHNFSAISAGQANELALLLIMVMVGSQGFGCILWLILAVLAGRTESRWIREELVEEVAGGLLSPDQALASSRYRSRVAARWTALRSRGVGHALQLGRLYSLCADLAFKKRQAMIKSDDSANQGEVTRLRAEIHRLQIEISQRVTG